MAANDKPNSPSLALQARASQIIGDRLAVKVEVVAQLLDCHRSQVYRLLDSGALESVQLSGGSKAGKRVSVPSLLEFIANGGCEHDRGPTPAEALAASRAHRGPSKRWL